MSKKIKIIQSSKKVQILTSRKEKSYEDLEKELKKIYKESKIPSKLASFDAQYKIKLELGMELMEEHIVNIWNGIEVKNHTDIGKTFLAMDLTFGGQDLTHWVILLRKDGKITMQSVSWELFVISNDILTKKDYKFTKTCPNIELLKSLEEVVGLTWTQSKDVGTNIEIPLMGKLLSLEGDTESIVNIEALTFRENGEIHNLKKMVYVNASNSYEYLETIYFSAPLMNAMKFVFDKVAKQKSQFVKFAKNQKEEEAKNENKKQIN